MPYNSGKVAVLWRGDRAARASARPGNSRYRSIFEKLGKLGIEAEPAVYDDEFQEEVRAQLRRVRAVLVWVNPIQDGRNRSRLNDLLREVALEGVWVSAHPDIIEKMGNKAVVHRTRHLSWGADTQLYASLRDLRSNLPGRLAMGPRVLKRSRGNDGQGVWKVEMLVAFADPLVRVCEAHGSPEPSVTPLSAFLASCSGYFEEGEVVLEQPFQARLRDGMTRCYLSEDKVVGFAHQHPSGLMEPGDMHPDAALGKVMFGPDEPRFARLRAKMETEWAPGLMASLDLAPGDLPVIWDADVLYGPRDAGGADTYVLGEINVSSVFATPGEAPAAIARTVARRLAHVAQP